MDERGKLDHSFDEQIPDGDNLPRAVCDQCNTIHYGNPNLIVGCLPEWENRLLLCKRAIEPRNGKWTVPAGFLENGETTAAGAQRETLEEANARVDIIAPYALYNIPHINQVYLLFRARLLDLDFSAAFRFHMGTIEPMPSTKDTSHPI